MKEKDDRSVTVIPSQISPFQPSAKIRVCAYVRVSTVHGGQKNSMENQEEYFTRKLSQNPGYEFLGVYTDFGVPGSKENRPGFDAMIKKARDGELDLVFTKSISRFARNTLLLLSMLRELKVLGVGVYFEEQNINTLGEEGELLISVLGSIAEEERKSVCQNIRQANQQRYKSGNPPRISKVPYGYTKDKDRNLIIDEKQAKVVRRIYVMYLSGISGNKIAKILNDENVPTFTKEPWSSGRILRMLSNEKYKGDLLMQKGYVDDFGKQQVNRGQRPKYLMRDHHPAIIPKDMWEKAVELKKQRKPKVYPFSSKLLCHRCGAVLIRCIHNGGYVSWICGACLQKGIAKCVGARITESVLLSLTKGMTIDEKMILLEVGNANKRSRKTKANYRLIPEREYNWGKRDEDF